MGKVRQAARREDDNWTWRIVDDLAPDDPVTAAELDAVEAFLMPLLNAVLSDETNSSPGKATARAMVAAAPTHKRLNPLLHARLSRGPQ
jgi:hypothetical protein